MTAIAALLLAGIVVGAPEGPEPPRILIRADDDSLRGGVALALVDEGAVVVAEPDDATHEVTIAPGGTGGLVVTCRGVDVRGATIAPGPDALVELELIHRVLGLVRDTPPRPAGAPRPRVVAELRDRTGAATRLAERTAAALLEAGVSLAPAERAEVRLCIDANAQTIAVSWGSTPDRCDGRPIGLGREDIVPRLLVAEALRLRDAAPAPKAAPRAPIALPSPAATTSPAIGSPPGPAPDATPQTTAPAKRSAAIPPETPTETAADTPAKTPEDAPPATPAVVVARAPLRSAEVSGAAPAPPPDHGPPALAVRAGVLSRPDAAGLGADPVLEVSGVAPLWHGIGPAVAVALTGGVVDPLLVGEGLAAAGLGVRWQPLGWLRVGADVVGGVWVHAWRFDATDAGFTFDPALTVPVSLDARVVDGVLIGLTATAGVTGRARAHTVQGATVWSRGPWLGAVAASVTVDISAGR